MKYKLATKLHHQSGKGYKHRKHIIPQKRTSYQQSNLDGNVLLSDRESWMRMSGHKSKTFLFQKYNYDLKPGKCQQYSKMEKQMAHVKAEEGCFTRCVFGLSADNLFST